MIDIGLNLASSQFKNDTQEVVNKALIAGVTKMIVTGTTIEQSRQAEQYTHLYPEHLYATAGIHPHHASSFNQQSIRELETLLRQEKVLAVGECGLDFKRNFSTPKEQLSCFEAQLELAVDLQLPVFLHQRDAHHEFLALIKKYRSGLVNAVAHCFTGGKEELIPYLEADMHIGITGWLCDERRGKALQDCVALIPKDKLMVETDAPYLFPRDLFFLPQYSGLSAKEKKKISRRNEPQYLPHIVNTLANYLDMNKEELARMTRENTQRFFALPMS